MQKYEYNFQLFGGQKQWNAWLERYLFTSCSASEVPFESFIMLAILPSEIDGAGVAVTSRGSVTEEVFITNTVLPMVDDLVIWV